MATTVADGCVIGDALAMLEEALLALFDEDETSADRVAVLGGGRGVSVGVAVELQATRSKNRVMSAMLKST
jgi:hypothetical protein